ncbi:hypothetical protein Aduo_007238 [Ancylostoma duodenale]
MKLFPGTIPGKAYHFSVSESTRHAYYVGFESLPDGSQLNTLRVMDTWKGTIMTYALPEELSSICMLYEAASGVALVGVGDDNSIAIYQAIIKHDSARLLATKQLIALESNSNEERTWSWNSARNENGMVLMELNQESRKLRIFEIKTTGKITCSEIDDFQTLGLAPYTQPWQEGNIMSTFERLPNVFGRLAYTGRILNIDIETRKVIYTRPLNCPFEARNGREIYAALRAPRMMKQIYRNGRLWIVAESMAHLGVAVSIWTITNHKWQYVMELKANYRDVTMDVTASDTAIILIKEPLIDDSCPQVQVKSLLMLRIGNVPRLTTIALFSVLEGPQPTRLNEHMRQMLERSSCYN